VLLPVSHPLASLVDLSLEDLRDEPFISYPSSPPSSVYLTVMDAFRQKGITPRIHQEVAETSSLVALVAAGLGVALAPAPVRHLRIPGVTHLAGMVCLACTARMWRSMRMSTRRCLLWAADRRYPSAEARADQLTPLWPQSSVPRSGHDEAGKSARAADARRTAPPMS